MINLLALYFQDFNREYLSTRKDRRLVGETLLEGMLTAVLIILAGLVLVLF